MSNHNFVINRFNKRFEDVPNEYINLVKLRYKMSLYFQRCGKTRNVNFLVKLWKKGHLKYSYKEQYKNQLEDIFTIIDSNYKDNWDIILEPEYQDSPLNTLFEGYKIWITILYPTINIKNSKGKEHTIKDLLVFIPLKVNNGNIYPDKNYIKGDRLTFSYEEYCSQYAHSHLRAKNFNSFEGTSLNSNFCLGSNEIVDLSDMLKNDFEKGNWELFFMTLNSMVSWESLEGNPYKYMRKISINTNSTFFWNKTTFLNYYKTYEKEFCKVLKDYVEVYVSDNILHLSELEGFEECLLKYLKEDISDVYNEYAVLPQKDDNMSYVKSVYSLNRDANNRTKKAFLNLNGKKPKYLFRGRERKVRIEKYKEKHKPTDNLILHPTFIKNIINELSKTLNKNIIKYRATKRLYQISNRETYIRKNPIPLPENT